MLERVLRAQSKRAAQDVALSRRKQGSSPLGSANQVNGLYRIGQLLLFPSPIFLQIDSGTARPACCALSCLRFPMRVNHCTPKAEVTSSNLVGRASESIA